ncbi:MAG: nucleoside-diphosphate-sugar epimerase [Flavobacteriaceae bacterium]|jgi:nucleoside-diphosphate-sugar epimerase
MNVTIIGCGWLGKSLGEQLHKSGHTVNGSTRNPANFEKFEKVGIQAFLLDSVREVEIPKEVVATTAVLIITVPPTSRNKGLSGIEENRQFMENVLASFSKDVRVIYTSSTGIYPKREREYYETYTFSDREQKTSLFQLESAVTSSEKSSVILRLGGLIGEGRHPIFSLEGREDVPNPEGPINFVHSGDVIAAIEKIMELPTVSGVYNLVNPMHPSRKSYYDGAAKYYGLMAPSFARSPAIHRLIASKKVIQELDYKFRFPINRFPKIDQH